MAGVALEEIVPSLEPEGLDLLKVINPLFSSL
jgi:hypothetical protein